MKLWVKVKKNASPMTGIGPGTIGSADELATDCAAVADQYYQSIILIEFIEYTTLSYSTGNVVADCNTVYQLYFDFALSVSPSI